MNSTRWTQPLPPPPQRRWHRLSPLGKAWFPERPLLYRRTEPIFALARPRRLKASARGALLWSVAFYALAALGLNVLMDHWCPAPFERIYREKWQQLGQLAATATDRPLAIMVGSSRTDAIFQASRLNGVPGPGGKPWLAYNLGVPAAGPMHEWMYLRDMLESGIRPSLLLVEFLPPLLNEAHTGLYTEENWTAAEWLTVPQYFRLRPYLARPRRKASEWMEARLAPWYIHRFALHGCVQQRLGLRDYTPPVKERHDSWGCRRHEAFTPAQRAYFTCVARDYIPSLNHFRLAPGLCHALRDLLECCRREQVPIVFILTPESAEFRSWYPPECLTAMNGLLEELHARYGVEVLDATRWLDDEDFVDGHHAAANGARKFTTRLLAELESRTPNGRGSIGIPPLPETEAR